MLAYTQTGIRKERVCDKIIKVNKKKKKLYGVVTVCAIYLCVCVMYGFQFESDDLIKQSSF